MPIKGQGAPAGSKPRRTKPEVKEETLTRPLLADLKRNIDTTFKLEDCERLLNDKEDWLRDTVSCEPEIEAIAKKVSDGQQEVAALARGNLEVKAELRKVLDQYDEKAVAHQALESRNQALEAELQEKGITKK